MCLQRKFKKSIRLRWYPLSLALGQKGSEAFARFVGAAHAADGLRAQVAHLGADGADFKLRIELLDLVLCLRSTGEQIGHRGIDRSVEVC